MAAELERMLDAVRAEHEATARRLVELEARMAELEAPAWLTLDEAAEHLRTSPGALRARAQRGQLPGAVKDVGRWLVDRRVLDAELHATLAATTRGASAARNGPAP